MQPDLRKWEEGKHGTIFMENEDASCEKITGTKAVVDIHNETVQLLKNAIEILADYVDKNCDSARIAEAIRMIDENEHEQD